MARMSFAKGALLLLLATFCYAVPATLRARQDPQCSLVATLKVLDSNTGHLYLNLYDNAGHHQGESIDQDLAVGESLPSMEGLEKTLWSTELLAADGSIKGGIMDIKFVYGDSPESQPFNWLNCYITSPIDTDGYETRQCWFPCAKAA